MRSVWTMSVRKWSTKQNSFSGLITPHPKHSWYPDFNQFKMLQGEKITASQNIQLRGSGFWTSLISLWVGKPSPIQAKNWRILCRSWSGQDAWTRLSGAEEDSFTTGNDKVFFVNTLILRRCFIHAFLFLWFYFALNVTRIYYLSIVWDQ